VSGMDPSEFTWVPFQEGGSPGYPFTNPLIPPSPHSVSYIPPLISTHGINKGNVNVLLSSVSDMPFPTAFKMLLASSMALWASSAPDVKTVKSLALTQLSTVSWNLSPHLPFPPQSALSDFQSISLPPPIFLTLSSPPPLLVIKMPLWHLDILWTHLPLTFAL